MIDWSLHAGDILLFVMGTAISLFLRPVFKLLVEMRDSLRDIHPRLESVEKNSAATIAQIGEHHDWLVQMRAKLGFDTGTPRVRH